MPEDAALWDDGRHNTPEGARLKAEKFAAFVHERFLTPETIGETGFGSSDFLD